MAFEFSPEEHAFLLALQQHGIKFIVVGLTSAVFQGAHVVTQDIDLWIDGLGSPPFLDAVKSVGGFYVAPGMVGSNPPFLGPQELSIFDLVTHMHGLDSFDKEYQTCQLVGIAGLQLHLLPLERIIKSKESAARQKDLAVLPALRATLIASNEKSKK